MQAYTKAVLILCFYTAKVKFWYIVTTSCLFSSLRRQYPPLSLLQLQRFIDLGRVDPSQPIDLTQLCNSGLFKIQIDQKHFGVNLTEEVPRVDSFVFFL